MLRSKYTYIRPQSEVYQLLEITEATVRGHLSACIAAVQYDLYRYGKEDITPITYQAGGGTYEYDYEKSPLFNYKVDVASANVYAEDLEAYYATNTLSSSVGGAGSIITVDAQAETPEYAFQLDEHDYLTVRVASEGLKANDKPYLLAAYTGAAKAKLLPELKGYSVQVGDVVRVAVTPNDYKELYDGHEFPYVAVEGFKYPTSSVLLPEASVVVETDLVIDTHVAVECTAIGSDTTATGLYGLTGSKWVASSDTGAALPAGCTEEVTAAVVGSNLEIKLGGSTEYVKISIPTSAIDFDINLQRGTAFKLKFQVHEPVAGWLQREVVALVGVTVPAEVGQPTVQTVRLSDRPSEVYPDGTFTVAQADEHSYRGTKDTNYVLTCVEIKQGSGFLGSKWTVTDTEDVDTYSYSVEIPEEAPAGDTIVVAVGRYGAKLTINLDSTHGGAVDLASVGDQVIIPCQAEAESTTEFDGVKLSAAPGDINTILGQTIEESHGGAVSARYARGITAVAFGKKVTGNIAKDNDIDAAWFADETGVTVLPGMALLVADRTEDMYVPFADGVGKLYVEKRVAVFPEDRDEDVFMLAEDGEIEENFGTIDPDNDLAYACSRALAGAAGREIYALRVRGVDTDAFDEAYKKTETDTALYSFVPVTKDFAVMEHFVQKGLDLSAADVKRWRRTILGVDFPGAYVVAKDDFDDKILKCNLLYYNGGYTLVQLSSSVNFSFKDMVFDGGSIKLNPGDLIQFGAGSKHQVKAVLSDRELLLAEDYHAPLQQVPFRLWKADTAANNVEYITGVARRFNTRRALVVWCDRGTTTTDDDTIVIDNKYLAAEIAGISSAVVPQQGITHTEITTINKATRMYTQYTQNQLDSIASQGVLIVTQDTKNTPCYIRHQLTTEMDKGNLYWEDSCTRNIDNISYAIVDAIDPFIGKANVTPSAIRKLRHEVSQTLDSFLVDSPNDLVGPSLVAWDNLTLVQDSVYMDRINIRVRLHLPLPLNNIRVEEIGIIAKVTI